MHLKGEHAAVVRARAYEDIVNDPAFSYDMQETMMSDLSVRQVYEATVRNCYTNKEEKMSYDIIIKGGILATVDGQSQTDIAITDGRFAAIGDLGAETAGTVIDAAGLDGSARR